MREIRSLCGRRASAVALTLLFAGSRAMAQGTVTAAPAPLELSWATDDPACDGDDVRDRALRLVSPDVVMRPLTASVVLQRQPDAWLVQIETRSADGEQTGRRSFRAESCENLEQAVALLLAMTLEARVNESLLPPPEPDPAPPPAPPPVPAAPLPPPPARPRDRPPAPQPTGSGTPLGWFLRLDGRAGVGLKPGLALGTGLAGGIRVGQLDLGVEGAYWPVTREPVPGAANAYALIQRASAGLRACWSFELGSGFVLAPCVIPEAVVFIVGSEGIDGSPDGPTPIPSVTGSLELRYALAGEHLSVLLGAAVSAEQRQPFQLTPENDNDTADGDPAVVPVYETDGIGPRLEIGLDARF
jgi:hypothetical protein